MPLYRVVRWPEGESGKSYAYGCPDVAGGWLLGRGDAPRVLYRLPELREGLARGETIHICEGEKKVHALVELGFVATTNDGGAGKWGSEHTSDLHKAQQVVIWVDNDDPGLAQADLVARLLYTAGVRDLRVVHFPELPTHGDVADWLQGLDALDAGAKRVAILERVAAAPQWKPAAEAEPQPERRGQSGDRRNPWQAIESAAAFINAPEPDGDFLEPRILARGSLTLVYSPRGIGKTLFAHALLVSQARMGRRALLIDRDNSRRELKRRLRGWGAGDIENLKVLGRDDAPSLTDREAWAEFPFADYDLVLIDSFDSSTEGIGEQDSARPSLALAPLLDIVHTAAGPAVFILGNTIKSGSHGRGSGVIEDRADIVFEVRDVTDMRPTGTRDWWLELPAADRGSWADRAGRRKKRDSYRLAFISTKFRIGEEPDPFVYEVQLSTDLWTCVEVTGQMMAAGEVARAKATQEMAAGEEESATALAAKVVERAAAGTPMRERDDAIPFLTDRGLSRNKARSMIVDRAGKFWRLDGGARRGDPRVLFPLGEGGSIADAAEDSSSAGPRQLRLEDIAIPASEESCGQPESIPTKAAPAAGANGAAHRPPIPTIQTPPGDEDADPFPGQSSAGETLPDDVLPAGEVST